MPVLLNRLLCVDGKSIKCTSSGGNTSQQNFTSLVSVYDDQEAGVVQLQIMQNKKQSEIGVAQNLISELASLPSGQTFSLDALHTQTATLAAIAAAGHHYLIAVKQNQPTLHCTIELTAQTQTAISHASVFDDSHGRTVERSVSVVAAPAELLPKWIGLQRVIMVHRTGTRAEKPFTETVYYLSSQTLPADTYMRLIRGHWAIENRLHCLDSLNPRQSRGARVAGLKMPLFARIIRPDWVVMLLLIGQFSLLGLSLWFVVLAFGLSHKLFACGLTKLTMFFLFLYETTLQPIKTRG